MSWIGGSISSLTGQLSNLTKDILTEGTEEISDHTTELRVAQEKIKEFDALCINQKIENDQLKTLVRELEEKSESSELQINSISREYRTLLEQKENEIKTLKQKQHESQELKSSFIGDDLVQPAVLQLSSSEFENLGYQQDDLDFGDNITMQHEINRLRNDVQKLQSECRHWKRVAQQLPSAGICDVQNESKEDTSALQKQIQDLEHELHQQKDQRQHELSSLQDAHAQKTSTLRRKHKQEVEELKQKISELENWTEPDDASQMSLQSLQKEIDSLQRGKQDYIQQISVLNDRIAEQESQTSISNAQVLHLENQLRVAREEIDRLLQDHDQVGRDLYDTKQRLLDQLDANHADALGVLSDLREVRQQMTTSAVDRRNKLLEEKEDIVSDIITAGQKKRLLAENVEDLESSQKKLSEETDTMVNELGDKKHQKLTADIINTIEKENLLLKKRNVSLQEQVTLLEKAVQGLTKERQQHGTMDHSASGKIGTQLGAESNDTFSDTMSFTSDISELSRRNVELDHQVLDLTSQISKYESEIEQFELMRSDWQMEKEALEDVLVQLREQMKEKENSLNVLQAQKGLIAIEKQEQGEESTTPEASDDGADDIASDMIKLDHKVGLLTDANAQLETERNRLLKEKKSLQRELDDLRSDEVTRRSPSGDTDVVSQLKQKEDEVRVLLEEKENLEKRLEEAHSLQQRFDERCQEVETLKLDLETMEVESKGLYQQLRSKEEELTALTVEKDEDFSPEEMTALRERLKVQDQELTNVTMEKEELQSSLEELDVQHEEAMKQMIKIRDGLQEANEELKCKLQSAETEVQNLNTELSQLNRQQMVNQSVESSTSNELNHQIAELKEDNSELRQRLKNYSLSVSSLEKEVKDRDTRLKEVNEKLVSSATALNDLHMDKEELEQTVAQHKKQLADQAAKLKSLRDENKELKHVHKDVSKESEGLLKTSAPGPNEDKVQQLQQQIKELENSRAIVSQELEKKKGEYVQLQSNLQAQTTDIERMKSLCVQKDEECAGRVQEVKAEVLTVREECERKDSDIKSLKVNLEEIHMKNVSLTEDVNKRTKEKENLVNDLDRISKEIESLKESLLIQSNENDILKNQLTDLNNKLVSKTTDCDILTSEMDSLKAELKKMGEEKLQLQQDSSELTSQLECQTDQLRQSQDQVREKLSEVECLSGKVNSLETELSEVMKSKSSLEGDIVKLKSECSSLAAKHRHDEEHLCNQHSSQCQNYESQLETLRFEKDSLNNELSAVEAKLQSQVKQYESYIEELQSSQELDTSTAQEQLSQLRESAHRKDLQISELESKVSSLESQLGDTQNLVQSSAENQKQLMDSLQERERELMNLKKDNTDLQQSQTLLENTLQQKEILISELRNQEGELFKMQQENTEMKSHLKVLQTEGQQNMANKDGRISELNAQLAKAQSDSQILQDQLQHFQNISSGKDAVSQKCADLEKKLTQLELEKQTLSAGVQGAETLANEKNKLAKKIVELEAEISSRKETALSKELERNEQTMLVQNLEEQLRQKGETVKSLQENCSQKDKDIMNLQEKLSQVNAIIEKSQHKLIDGDPVDMIKSSDSQSIHKEKGVIELVEVQETAHLLGSKQRSAEQGSSMEQMPGDDPEEILQQIDDLRKQLSVKDDIIAELQRNNSSLLKMLDNKSKSTHGDSTLLDMHKLENEIRSLKIEREQMMAVMNEKSREASNLKSESQRLMNIVSAQKAALDKLQKDNQELVAQTPGESDGNRLDDMQKEVVQNLSRIIRDKDLEIESLKQKSETLVSVLQESSQDGSQINTLMQDKENLTRQLTTLQNEREQMVAYVNQKHQESVLYHSEVQRLSAFITAENEKTEEIKQSYEKLVPQFEDKKQALLKMQNELINYKQKYTELEVKYGQLLQESSVDETVDKATFDSKTEENQRLQERYKELLDSVKEKEMKIQNLHQMVSEMEQNLSTVGAERTSFKKQMDNLVFQLQGLQTESGELKGDITALQQQKNQLISEVQTLKETNSKQTLELQSRDFELQSLNEKTVTLTAILQEQQGEKGQLDHLMQESESNQKHLRQLQQERDQALMALNQKQAQTSQMDIQVQALQHREEKLTRELARLREHLVQIEDGYTQEALAAEEREKELRNRLAAAEDRVLTSTSAVENASQQASHQIDSLQQQLQFVSSQRDQAYLQLSTLQEQNQILNISMTNLQLVLEQFQTEKENMVAEETERLTEEVTRLKLETLDMQSRLDRTQQQLDEAADGLEAAARLSEQLDRKEEAVNALKEEVQIREAALKIAEDEIEKLRSRTEDKVDKLVIKNLFLGYFTTPQNQREEVLRAIGGVLLFTQEDFNKIDGHSKSWVPGFLRFGGNKLPVSPPTTPVRRSTISTSTPKQMRGYDSFSEMFVKFLERESSPPPPAVRLPAEEMVRDVQKQKESHKPVYNPFTAPRHVAMPIPAPSVSGAQNSHILIGSEVSVSQSLPTFAAPSENSLTPPGSGRSTPAATSSSAFLKDVLNAR